MRTVATGLDTPCAIAWLPDGRALVTERPGRVRLLSAEGRLKSSPSARSTASSPTARRAACSASPSTRSSPTTASSTSTGPSRAATRCALPLRRRPPDRGCRRRRGHPGRPIHNGGRLAFGPDDGSTSRPARQATAPSPRPTGSTARSCTRPTSAPAVCGPRSSPAATATSRGSTGSRGPADSSSPSWGRTPTTRSMSCARGGELRLARRRRGEALDNYEDVIAPSGATSSRAAARRGQGDFVFANLVGEQLRRLSFDGGRVTRDEDAARGRLRPTARRRRGARRRPLRADQQPRRPRRPGGRRRPHPPPHPP